MGAARQEDTRLPRRMPPGKLIYFSGGVHEVLPGGTHCRYRDDLAPGAPRSLWRPIWSAPARRRGRR